MTIRFKETSKGDWQANVDNHPIARIINTRFGFIVEDWAGEHIGTCMTQIAAFDLVKKEWEEVA